MVGFTVTWFAMVRRWALDRCEEEEGARPGGLAGSVGRLARWAGLGIKLQNL
jgi:hypothetical protein